MHQLDWNAAIDSIRETLPQAQFLNWFKPLEFIRADERAIVLGVPSRFHEEWLRSHYTSHLQQAIKRQCGTERQLEFEILVQEENIEASMAPIVTPVPAPPAPGTRPALRLVNGAEPERTEKKHQQLPVFANRFFELDYNRVPNQCALMFAEGKDRAMATMVIVGGVGMGKTHLLAETGKRVLAKDPNCRVRYTSFEAFTDEWVQSLRDHSTIAFNRKWREETDCVLFDDIQGLAKRAKTQEAFLHIFNEIVARGGRVAFTSSVPINRLENFIDPLKSRLLAAVITDIKPTSFDEKVELLGRMCGENGWHVDPTVLRTFADQGQKDVRELLGTLFRAQLQAKLENRPLDASFLAREGWNRETQRQAITLSEIVSLVEHNYGVSRDELTSKSRKGATAWARQVAMYLARTYTLLPLEEIGKTFGRDHSTVIHAFQKVSETMKSQPTRQYEVEFLKQKLENRGPKSDNPLV